MKIAAFTNHIDTPSSRFRIRQYTEKLKANNIFIHDFYRKFSTQTATSKDAPKRIRNSFPLILKAVWHESNNIYLRLLDSLKSNQYDGIWLSRQLIIGYPSFEFLLKKPIIYDIDDAIYLAGKLSYSQFKQVTQKAEAVIAGNAFLAEEAAKYNKNIHIVPTAVNVHRWNPGNKNSEKNTDKNAPFYIGWSGTSSSFKFFLPYQKAIKQFLVDYPQAKFLVMADRFPLELKELKSLIHFENWSPESEVSFIQSLDIGLMPMGEGLWSNGKCAYKMLLYAACGVPVVVSPVGVNKKILQEHEIGFGPRTSNEWYESFESLYKNAKLRKKLGQEGIQMVQEHYSVDVCGDKIIQIFKKNI